MKKPKSFIVSVSKNELQSQEGAAALTPTLAVFDEFGIKGKVIKTTIDVSDDHPLTNDSALLEMVILARGQTIRICNIYRDTPSNRKNREIYQKRASAIKTLLRDPYLPISLKATLKDIPIVNFPKASRFTTDLATQWSHVYQHLKRTHKQRPKQALRTILDLISNFFKEEPLLKYYLDRRDDTFEDNFRKALSKIKAPAQPKNKGKF